MRHSEEQIKRWGSQASEGLLNRGVPLFDSIKKISEENDLNKEQIKRISEIANTKTMISIYDSKLDNTAEFNVVNPVEVIRALGKCDQKPMLRMNRFKTASLDYSRSFKENLATDVINVKLAHRNTSKRTIRLYKEMKLAKMKKIATLMSGESQYARSKAKRSLYKHASKIDELAKAIMDASKKGITNDEMLRAALRMGDDPGVVRRAFEKALEVVKSKSNGIFNRISNMASNAWSGVKSFFKVANDGTVSVNRSYLKRKIDENEHEMKESKKHEAMELKQEHPLNKALSATFESRHIAKEDDGIARTMEQVAEAAAKQVKRIKVELKGDSND